MSACRRGRREDPQIAGQSHPAGDRMRRSEASSERFESMWNERRNDRRNDHESSPIRGVPS